MATKEELKAKFNRVSSDKSQLQQFVYDLIDGKIISGGDNQIFHKTFTLSQQNNTLVKNTSESTSTKSVYNITSEGLQLIISELDGFLDGSKANITGLDIGISDYDFLIRKDFNSALGIVFNSLSSATYMIKSLSINNEQLTIELYLSGESITSGKVIYDGYDTSTLIVDIGISYQNV